MKPISHNEKDILERAYVPLVDVPYDIAERLRFDGCPTFATMRRVHMEFDLAWGGVKAFRVFGIGWKLYRAPDAESGFREVALLP